MDEKKQDNSTVTSPLRAAPSRFNLAKFIPAILMILIITAGIFTGLVLSGRSKNKATAASTLLKDDNLSPEQKQSVQAVTRDSTEGTIEKNDKFEETAQGQWKLIRPGGDSQTAYLTSSFLDLDQYIGKKVKIYGETLGSQKVGWLMDVAKVEVQ